MVLTHWVEWEESTHPVIRVTLYSWQYYLLNSIDQMLLFIMNKESSNKLWKYINLYIACLLMIDNLKMFMFEVIEEILLYVLVTNG